MRSYEKLCSVEDRAVDLRALSSHFSPDESEFLWYLRWKKSGALDALFHTNPDGEWGVWKLTARPLAAVCEGANPWHQQEFSRKNYNLESNEN